MTKTLILLFFSSSSVFAQTLFDASMLEKGSDSVANWEQLAAADYPVTDYVAIEDEYEDGQTRLVLKASSNAGATGYWRDESYSLESTPFLSWSWKIIEPPSVTQAGTKKGDDFAVRLFVGFDHDSLPSITESVKLQFAKSTFGREPARRTLVYVWQPNNEAESEFIESAYNPNTQYIVLTEGEPGEWLHFERNVLEDYKKAFNEEPYTLMGFGIMTDADNSKGFTEAYYGDIERH